MPRLLTFIAVILTVFSLVDSASAQTRNVLIDMAFDRTITNGQGEAASAVFHDVSAIDAQGRRLMTIDFGTEEGHAIQVSGFYGDASSASYGPTQWAAQQLSLSIPVPDDSEGLIFTLGGGDEGLWAEVTVDGNASTTLRVDNYWHEAYVPISDPVQENLPDPVLTWPPDRLFPELPDSDRIFSITVRSAMRNWSLTRAEDFRMDDSFLASMALTLVGMQGVINRHTPRVFLRWNTAYDADGAMLEHLEDEVEVIHLDLDPLSALNFLWRRYGHLFEGTVIYDPEVPNTINLATMMAGLENRLILHSGQLDLPGLDAPDDVLDLVAMAQAEGWDNSERGQYLLYQWVYDNLWQDLEHRVIGMISPGPPVAGSASEAEWYPVALAERDYYIALNIPSLHLDPAFDPDQSALWARILDEIPSPAAITGVFRNNEAMTVETASRYGHFVAGISWPGFVLDAGNLSVLGGIRPPAHVLDTTVSPDEIMAALSADRVVTGWTSDGDPLNVATAYAPFVENLAGQRMGLAFEPWFQDIAPILWNHYTELEAASGLSFIGAFSGNGYAWPLYMSDLDLQEYAASVRTGLDHSGMRVAYVDDEGREMDGRLPRAYHEAMDGTGFLGTFSGAVHFDDRSDIRYYGVPTPYIFPQDQFSATDDREDAIIAELMSLPPVGNIFKEITADHIQAGSIVADADASGGEAALIGANYGSDPTCCFAAVIFDMHIPPGEYTARFRMKVADTSSNEHRLQIWMLEQDPEVTQPLHVVRSIAPSEFSQANEYQEFTLSFSNERMIWSAAAEFIYNGGAGDIHLDTVELVRHGEPITPFLAYRLNGLVFPNITDYGLANRVWDKIEAEGGLYVSPNAFMASLNPEFMIDFAHTYLPAGNELVAEAEAQLSQGHFYNAVLKIRQALRAGTGVSAEEETIPSRLETAVYPNPTSGLATITIELPSQGPVHVTITDLLGRQVFDLDQGVQPTGSHDLDVDTSQWAAAVYFVTVQAGPFRSRRSLVVVR